MKQLLQLNGKDTEFREPFILYDTIPVYDKSRGEYVPKKRSSAVSVSDVGEIIIVTTICSDKDTFNKKTARSILQGRLNYTIEQYHDCREARYVGNYTEGSYLFVDLATFEQFCDALNGMGRQYFAPYSASYANKLTNHPEDVRMDNVSDVYMHRDFVAKTWNAFADAAYQSAREGENLDTTTFDEEPEAPANTNKKKEKVKA